MRGMLSKMFRAIAGVICLLASNARAEPTIRMALDAGTNGVDVSDHDGGHRSANGSAARAAVQIALLDRVALGFRIGVTHIGDGIDSSTRYANPIVDAQYTHRLRRAIVRAGFSAAVPVAEIRNMYGFEYRVDEYALEAAARVWGRWDAWQWTPGVASLVLPASIEMPVAKRVTLQMAAAGGVAYSTDASTVDGRRALVGQAAIGGELHFDSGGWLSGRLLGVGFSADRETSDFSPERSWEREDLCLDVGGGIRSDQLVISARWVILFADVERPGISIGIETWR